MIDVDTRATADRIEALRNYCDSNITDGNMFVCSSLAGCRGSLTGGISFHPGQLSYVGSHYDLEVDGQPFRVLIVAMETGRPDELVTLEQRRFQIRDRIPEPMVRRNAHMIGTTLALRVLHGRVPGADRDGEFVLLRDQDGRPTTTHLFDTFAMANLRLCSAIAGDTQSRATPTMSRNCLRHLTATIRILQPTVIVLQGSALRTALDSEVVDAESVTPGVEKALFAGVPVLLSAFTHPAARSLKDNWARLTNAPYLHDVVAPALRAARSIALGDGAPPAGVTQTGQTSAKTSEPARPISNGPEGGPAEDLWHSLLRGPAHQVSALPTSTGDEAGVFTLWHRGVLVHFGRAGNAVESRPSNHRQADGVRGRVRSLVRQPGRPLQVLLARKFPDEWAEADGASDEARARSLLLQNGACRIIRFGTRAEADTAYAALEPRLKALVGVSPR